MATKKAPAKGKKRSVTKKQHSPDYYPIQRSVRLGVDGGTLTGVTVGDAGKLLSISNRRLYRQGKLYELKIDIDSFDTTVAPFLEVHVYALRNNWDVQRAWAEAKKTYDEAYADELSAGSSAAKARWMDFRVRDGITGSPGVLDPIVYNASLAAQVENKGEFILSSVDVAGTENTFSWGTSGSNTLFMLSEWFKKGQTSTSPQSVTTAAAYAGVNADNLSDNEMASMQNDGNSPPYATGTDQDQWHRVATLYVRTAPDGNQKLSTGYFQAPCGLFALDCTHIGGGGVTNGTVSMTVKSGDYKGVHALNMAQE